MKCPNRLWVSLSLALLPLISCNQADHGFSAPAGSSVEISGLESTPAGEDSYVIATVKVEVPFNETFVPGNNIEVSVFCTRCSLFDHADGESLSTDPDLLASVSNPYSFATGKSGTYQFVVKVENPSDLGLTDYTAKVTADIGVSTASMEISVGTE